MYHLRGIFYRLMGRLVERYVRWWAEAPEREVRR